MLKEAQEQAALIEYCDYRRIPVFAIPNGGKRDVREAMNLKKQGVKAGVPDLFFPIAKKGKHGLFIEMKVGRNKTTSAQEKWLAYLASAGYETAVCYGFQEARKTIEEYLKWLESEVKE